MCIEGFRAHDKHFRVQLADPDGVAMKKMKEGRALIKVEKPELDFEGWMFESPQKGERLLRRRVLALEREVSRWHSMARLRRTAQVFEDHESKDGDKEGDD